MTSIPLPSDKAEAMVEAVARAIDPSWWAWADIHFVPTIEDDVFRRQRSLERAQRAIETITAALSGAEEIERLTHERQCLAEAIANAAKKAGIYNGDMPLSGPHLLLLADDIATVALSTPPAGDMGAVEVKPLEWNPFRAETPFGYYHIDDQTDRSQDELEGRPPFLLSGSRIDLARYPTLKAARDAAQSDYTSRILSALSSSPVGEMEDRETLKTIRSMFEVEYHDDGRIASVGHASDGLRKMVSLLDTALASSGGGR